MLAFFLLAGCPRVLLAQALWEYSPYQVKVCIAASPEPEFAAQFFAHTCSVLESRAGIVFFATWKMEASVAPPAISGQILTQWDSLSFDLLKSGDPNLAKGDKLYLVALTKDGGDYLVRVREIDLRTCEVGPAVERRPPSLSAIPLAAWDAISESFVPLARIEAVQDKERKVSARLRAGGLITDPASLALIQPGDALRPVIRRNDRSGEPIKGGIQPLPWTVLSVLSRNDVLLDCNIASGFRTSIPARASARMERLAVLSRPRLSATRVVLQSRGKDSHPLSGYEVYVKGLDDKPTELVGVTDWRGAIEISRGDVPVRTLYVKNGNQLLARLPLVPGDQEVATAALIEDDFRLQTEGFVLALHGRVTDLVARREILAIRIRKRISEGKLVEAETLLEEYRQLESRDDLIRELDAQQGKMGQSGMVIDKITQKRIDKLMGEARTLLVSRYLDPDTKNVLAKELEKAKTGTAAASTGS